VLVGLGVAVWLNSLGGSTGGTHEIRQVTERRATAFESPRARLAIAAAAERAHNRAVHARQVRHRRRVAARRRATARARRRAPRPVIDPRYPVTDEGQQSYRNPYYEQAETPAPQTVTQRAPEPTPASAPKPKRSGGGGGGGSTPFDDSG
jgi:hypothetical protein